MINLIISFIIGIISGIGIAYWLGDRSLKKTIKKEKENIRDWYQYSDECKKYR